MAVLHMICGLPGAGKSTRALALERETGALRFTPDEWLMRITADARDEAARAAVEALQWELARALLARGVDVILENGFWSRAEREAYRAGALAAGARVRLHYMDAGIDELKRRIAMRNAHPGPYDVTIDPAEVDGWAALFEPPGPDELDELPEG